MLAKEIKPGTIVVHNEAPHIIESVSVQSPSARGGATLYKFRSRNLVTKQKSDITLKGTESLPDADFAKREVTFMFADTETVHFLDSGDYNQYSIAAGRRGERAAVSHRGSAGHARLDLQRRVRRHSAAGGGRSDDHRVRPGGERQLGHVAHEAGDARDRRASCRCRSI